MKRFPILIAVALLMLVAAVYVHPPQPLPASALFPQSLMIPGPGAAPGSAPATSFDVGFDFRNTLAFVTDPSCCAFEANIGQTADYPTTGTVNGYSVTYGWEFCYYNQARDRSATVDPRIAGVVYIPNGNPSIYGTFRVDLPATGIYNIGVAGGDMQYSDVTYFTAEDGTTPFITIGPLNTGAGQAYDAAGNIWSASAWPASNVMVSHTFTTTIFRVIVAGTSNGSGTGSALSNVRITKQ